MFSVRWFWSPSDFALSGGSCSIGSDGDDSVILAEMADKAELAELVERRSEEQGLLSSACVWPCLAGAPHASRDASHSTSALDVCSSVVTQPRHSLFSDASTRSTRRRARFTPRCLLRSRRVNTLSSSCSCASSPLRAPGAPVCAHSNRSYTTTSPPTTRRDRRGDFTAPPAARVRSQRCAPPHATSQILDPASHVHRRGISRNPSVPRGQTAADETTVPRMSRNHAVLGVWVCAQEDDVPNLSPAVSSCRITPAPASAARADRPRAVSGASASPESLQVVLTRSPQHGTRPAPQTRVHRPRRPARCPTQHAWHFPADASRQLRASPQKRLHARNAYATPGRRGDEPPAGDVQGEHRGHGGIHDAPPASRVALLRSKRRAR